MIKAKAQRRDGSSFVVLGLTRRNTELLLAGKPIPVDLREMGIDCQVLIMGGETEDAMAAELKDFIDSKTIVDDQRGRLKQ
jgi:hypothetical protein